MRLKYAHVKNFRALEDASIEIDPKTTLVVGRNNSGKTSLVDIFCKFFHLEQSAFALEDLSTVRLQDIKEAVGLYVQGEQKRSDGDYDAEMAFVKKAIDKLPAISLSIGIEYEETDDLATLSEVIMDLDSERHDALIVATVEIEKPLDFFNQYIAERESADKSFEKYLAKRFRSVFQVRYYAVDAQRRSHRIEIKRATVDRIFSAKFIYAQNKLDDTSVDNTRNLSRTFESYYQLNRGDNPSVEKIELALADVSNELDGEYAKLFEPIFDDLNTFGIDTITPLQKLKVVALLEAGKVLEGNTRLYYEADEGNCLLPENHNGLGYTKLIFTILQVVGFYENYAKVAPRPAFQVLFIEEPEAHLHPQMQEVFIKNIREFIAKKIGWNVQVVVTTHSSHIVASSGFEGIRYFDNSGLTLRVKDLSAFRHAIPSNADETLRFLTQYMVLHRCDMFFADKVILIEGAVERLLLARMIDLSAPKLRHQYISVVEVGGAYAIKFKELIDFIGIQTLVVADIDSVNPAVRRKACPVAEPGAVTSNIALKDWLPKEESINNLLALPAASKSNGLVRIAYQVPEESRGATGRSFEEAFIIKNAKLFAQEASNLALARVFEGQDGLILSPSDIESEAYEIARLIEKKTDFAFDILSLDGWEVPLYIREGLEWLAQTPSKK